jgi:hypothetical protein
MKPRKRNSNLRVIQLAIGCLLAQAMTVLGLNFNVPLSSLTNHNTSACANYSPQFGGLVSQNFGATSVVDTSLDTININSNLVDMSLNPVTPGHVSHVNVHTLIPKRPDLRWFANGTCWWGEGPSHHVDNGTTNTTAAYAAAMVSDLESRGFDGLIFSWYGKGDQTDLVAQNVQQYLASAANTNKNFTFTIMIVFGYFVGGETTNNVEYNIHYCETNYFNDPHYEKENGHPLLMFFNVSPSYFSNSQMAAMKADTSPNTYWVQEGTGEINQSWVDMTYLWTDDYNQANTNELSSTTPYNINAATNHYSSIKAVPGKQAYGAMCAHFNGTLTKSISWSLGKYLPSGNGLCEYYRAQAINASIPTNMTRMQWATWSDYEEGTEIETGTENYVGLTASLVSSNILSWIITSGDERTVDHYEVYAVTNGGNAALLSSVPSGTHQASISQLVPGFYQLYVDAIGLPCIRDHLSTPAAYTGQPSSLPSPWISQDIGSVGVWGNAAYTNGTFTVNGSGVDIWNNSDSYQFVYQPWTGDGQIVARVVSMQNTAPAAKAGLMFRETLDPASAEGNLSVTPSKGISMQGRTSANASTSNVNTMTNLMAPYWLSLIRQGNYLYSYVSPDGVNWTSVGTNVYSMASSIYVGLCVTSKSNPTANTALFDNVTVGASTVVGAPIPAVNALNFTSSVKVTFTGYNRPETLSNFPALVRLGTNVPGFSYAQFASPVGGDLRFANSNALELPYEINQWNTNGISTVWVQLPALASTNDTIVAYWGNPGGTNAPNYTTNGTVWAGASQQSPYDVVYHLEQNGFPYFDSTLQYPSTNGTTPGSTNGIIGSAGYFTRSPYLDAGTVNLGNAFTLSAWVYVSSNVSDIQCIWANGPGVSASAQIFFYVNDYKTSDGALILATGNGTTAGNLAAPAGSVSLNQWHLVTAVVDRADAVAQLYVDGNQVASGAVRNDFPINNDMELGRDTSGSFAFLGALDEARIHSSLESSNWVWASYMTVAANASLENYSAVGSPAASLSIQTSGGNVILGWPQGTLQSAGQISGPYNDVPGATSPYTNGVSGIQQYFRVRVQ